MRPLVRTLTAALAGVGAGLSFEPYHWAYLLPLSVAVVTLLCLTSSPGPASAGPGRAARAGLWLGFVFGTAFMLVLLPWLTVIGPYAWVPLAVVEGLFYGLAGLATALVVRLPAWPLRAASSWVAVEALRASFPFGGFPWGRLAFATEDTPVAPALAYVGAPGATFLVALVGTALAWAVLRARRSPIRATFGVLAAVVLATFAAVAPYPHTTAGETRRSLTVAAVQGNVPGVGLEAFAERRAVLNNHVSATEKLARRIDAGQAPRPDLVLWPENSSDIDPYADLAAHASIADAVRAVRAPLLMGAVVGDRVDSGWYNRAILWSADGTPGAYYDKTHPVPFGEYIPLRSLLAPLVPALDQIPSDMVRGTRPGVLEAAGTRVGVLMCFEVVYDGLLHDLVRDGADLIVVPTNNATYTGTGQIEQQFAMSRLRAIETNRFVVVASTNGISGVIAPDGHVVARAPQQRQVVLEQRLPLTTRTTPAVVMGAWPERALGAISAISVIAALLLGYRRRTDRKQIHAPVPDLSRSKQSV